MKIYSLLLVKNEADIICATVESAAQWSDKIIVFDNGSTDGTWEKIQELSRIHSNVIPYKQDNCPFKIGLRALPFNEFREEMNESDWWCIRLDADEFYLDNPKEFLSKVPQRYKQVWKSSIDFYLTKEDLCEYQFEGSFEENEKNIRYYDPNTWTEIRFLRHRKNLKWRICDKKPSPEGLIYPEQIRVLHYQFRNPKQMESRFLDRQEAKKSGCKSFKHENGESWKDYLKSRENLCFDNKDGKFIIHKNRNKFNRFKLLSRF